MPSNPSKTGARPPIVAVVGHIDHGKSTLLDYIRNTNVVEGEAGGITQHLSAYQAVHENAAGKHAITFLDTPGHAAFVGMRSRGLEVADVAILVVSSEEGIKPQTVEALDLIKSADIPYVIAFTKIDKPGANLERAKLSMLEHQVFIEGMGGDVPWVGVSSKSGEGIPELLDLILLAAELEEITADPSKPGRGLIIEAHTESKRGNTAMQTVEALDLIKSADIPYVIAFTKIDKPGANLERAKLSMLEHQVFIEGMGGDVPWVGVSSKSGEGIPELLDLILLAAELEEITADPSKPGRGLIIEAHTESKRGNTAMLIVLDGTVASGKYVVAGECTAPVRIMENFLGKPVKEAGPSEPIRIVGFTPLPAVGTQWEVVANKKEAEAKAAENRANASKAAPGAAAAPDDQKLVIPLIIKTDVAGTGEAVVHEIQKLPQHENLEVRVVARGVGAVTEGDIKMLAGSTTPGLVVGFNVKVEAAARELAERQGVTVNTFDIIYKLAEWLAEITEERRPRAQVEEIKGAARAPAAPRPFRC